MTKEYSLIEFMPACWRASHVAAGNDGVYPHNGAERCYVEGDVPEDLLDPRWARVVLSGITVLPPGESAHNDVPADALA